MSLSQRRWIRHRISAKRAAFTLVSLFVAAFLGAMLNSHFARRDAVALTIQQQNYALVQQFLGSGQQVNMSFQAFNDALVDAQEAHRVNPAPVRAARKALRDAIGQHSSQTYSIQSVLGPQATKYVNDLATFRTLVDATTEPADAMPMAQAGMDLIAERQQIADGATKRLGLSS